jgi:phosphoribosylformylglycinamidine (FGAM) synthase-like enzyme
VSDSTELDETDVVPEEEEEEVLVSTVGELIEDGTRFSIRTEDDFLLLSLLTMSDGVAGGTLASHEAHEDGLGLLRVGVQGAPEEEEEVSSRSCKNARPAAESAAVQSIAETILNP